MYRLLVIAAVTNVVLGNSDWPTICPKIFSKTQWGARSAVQIEYAIIPIQFVIVHHTVTPECNSVSSCVDIIKNIQNFHMETLDFHDIGYNFLVGGDGHIYEGAGWHKVGAHTRGYNTRSLGLAFIGNFTDKKPNEKQLQAAKDLLQCGVELGELDKRYKLFGARQVSATSSPGLKLYYEIKNWPNFSTP